MTQRKSQVNLLTIDKFAKIAMTTPRTLRFYEQKGLLKPYEQDLSNHYRFYHPNQVLDFTKIKLLQKFNLSLKNISNIKRENEFEFLKSEIKKTKEELDEKIKNYKFLEWIINFFYNDGLSTLKTEYIGPFDLICFYVKKGSYIDINNYVEDLWKVTNDKNIKCENREILFYLDPYFKPKETQLETALICKEKINRNINLPKNFYFRHFPKTKVNTLTYKGLYEYLSLIYNRLDYYYLKNNIEIKGHVFELYENGPYNTKSQYDYITNIYY